jgi:hypothetical protein
MQIKTTLRSLLTPVRRQLLRKQQQILVEMQGKKEPQYTIDRNVNPFSHYGNQNAGSSNTRK